MGKKKRTLLIAMLSLFLAALVAAAAVFGVSLSRSAFSDGTEAAAGEARWRVAVGTVKEEEAEVDAVSIRPDYTPYTGEQRTNDFTVCIATLENDGDMAASVALERVETGTVVDRDTEYPDSQLFSDDEIAEHVKVSALYYSTSSDKTSSSDLESLDNVKLAPGDSVYIYAAVTWITDLAEDMDEWYDGTLGDEFDTWAGERLESVVFTVTLRCEQAS